MAREKRGDPAGWGGKCEWCGYPATTVACPQCGLWAGLEYEVDDTPIKGALDSAKAAMAFCPRDWSEDRRDAWLYGIIVGWSDEALEEVGRKHGWSGMERARLKQLRAEMRAAFGQ